VSSVFISGEDLSFSRSAPPAQQLFQRSHHHGPMPICRTGMVTII
jgi:hypothetical protein